MEAASATPLLAPTPSQSEASALSGSLDVCFLDDLDGLFDHEVTAQDDDDDAAVPPPSSSSLDVALGKGKQRPSSCEVGGVVSNSISIEEASAAAPAPARDYEKEPLLKPFRVRLRPFSTPVAPRNTDCGHVVRFSLSPAQLEKEAASHSDLSLSTKSKSKRQRVA